jgi:predicted dehydrogenase
VDEVREMLDSCRRNNVQFMDGVMFMHNPRLNRIRQALDDGNSMGAIKRITSAFSFLGAENFLRSNIRANSALEPLGCLGDVGWYCIRFALWTMKWQLPREVTGRIINQASSNRSRSPVPFEFSGEIFFNGGVSSGFHCSFVTIFRNWADVTSVKGYLRVPDFALPAIGNEGGLEINGVLANDSATDPARAQEVNMIRNFSDQALSGKLNDDWPEWSLKTQMITNACFQSAIEARPIFIETPT